MRTTASVIACAATHRNDELSFGVTAAAGSSSPIKVKNESRSDKATQTKSASRRYTRRLIACGLSTPFEMSLDLIVGNIRSCIIKRLKHLDSKPSIVSLAA
jgi:hypothetical protein